MFILFIITVFIHKKCVIKLMKVIVMNNKVHDIADDNFDTEVLKSEQLVLVDYWADGCGPCKMLAPILDEIVSDFADRLKVTKLNINDNPTTPEKYRIRGVPTLMLFKNGEVVATKIGPANKIQLTEFIEKNA